jgi:sigma-54 specific flagellar transcriptional regulator A
MHLTSDARAWLSRFSDLIYTNPFSLDTDEVLRRFAVRPEALGQRDHPFGMLSQDLRERLHQIDPDDRLRIDQVTEADRPLLRVAWLFDLYDRHIEPIGALIAAQEASPEQPVPVPFARATLGSLAARGFSDEQALRYLGLLFQLRRAFHFIDRNLIGTSPCMRRLRMQLWDSLFTRDARDYERYLWERMEDFATLLLGATGTGKGSAAAAIGRAAFIPFDPVKGRFSESFMRGFTAINLNEYPESLVESELFGHRKGAFTGAVGDYQGLFGRCSAHGALFLDEIGEIGVPLQIKLLRVLQERLFSPVGSREPQRFSGRIIAATNQDLDHCRAEGRMRDDFFYRLSSLIIQVPSLRQRLDEAPTELEALTRSLLERIVGSPDQALLDRVLTLLHQPALAGYPWPGNVRELEQAIRRILLTGDYAPGTRTPANSTDPFADEPTIKALNARYCAELYRRHGSFEAVSRRAGVDRRTARKYVTEGMTGP